MAAQTETYFFFFSSDIGRPIFFFFFLTNAMDIHEQIAKEEKI